MSIDDIVKFLDVQNFLINDDAQVIISAPSEYLKYQSLLECLQKFKLSVWIMICDLLHDKSSLEHVSSLLIEGKFYNYMHTHKCS